MATDEEIEEVRLGPMSPEEKAQLLALADELRERNIDPAFWLRALFVDPWPAKRRGRKPSVTLAERERNERRLAHYEQTLAMLRRMHDDAPASARTVEELRAGLHFTGSGFEPYLRAIAAYRRSRHQGHQGDLALSARAAMLVFSERDPDRALRKLGTLQTTVRRERKRRTTE